MENPPATTSSSSNVGRRFVNKNKVTKSRRYPAWEPFHANKQPPKSGGPAKISLARPAPPPGFAPIVRKNQSVSVDAKFMKEAEDRIELITARHMAKLANNNEKCSYHGERANFYFENTQKLKCANIKRVAKQKAAKFAHREISVPVAKKANMFKAAGEAAALNRMQGHLPQQNNPSGYDRKKFNAWQDIDFKL